MYKVLKIGEKDYKLEYTIEASLYDECIESLVSFLGNIFGAINGSEFLEKANEKEKEMIRSAVIKSSLSSVGNLPSTALTVFYAGLMENHGSSGDNSVLSKQDAKQIVKEYFKEHKGDGTDNFYDLLMICLEQMGEDGFFERTGLVKLMNSGTKNQKSSRKPRVVTKDTEK